MNKERENQVSYYILRLQHYMLTRDYTSFIGQSPYNFKWFPILYCILVAFNFTFVI